MIFSPTTPLMVLAGLLLATPAAAEPPLYARNCGESLAPDGLNRAVLAEHQWSATSRLITAMVCDRDYRCDPVASTPPNGEMALQWTPDGSLHVWNSRPDTTPVGDRRYSDRARMPKVVLESAASAKSRPVIGATGSLTYVASRCATVAPIR